MSMVFRGGPVLTLDGKGRLTVPSRWRELLMANVQGQLVVAKNPARCLSLFPLPVWEGYQARLMDPATPMEWRRIVIGSATDVEIDSGSRVLIPPELRQWAGLEKDVKFMGVGSFFELWDSARFDASEDKAFEVGPPDSVVNVC